MKWWAILTQPLGVTGLALALVFGVLGVKLKDREKPWFLPVSIGLAAICIIGGLFLADKQIKNESNKVQRTIIQSTSGANSPAIQGNRNNITIIKK